MGGSGNPLFAVTSIPIQLQEFANTVSPWLRDKDSSNDVVVSCRVRLARNLRSFHFSPRLSGEQAVELAHAVRPALEEAALDGETLWVPLEETSLVLRLMLRERHLISRDLAPSDQEVRPGRALAFGAGEGLSVMVNEEDHLRLQSVSPGFSLDQAHQAALELDRFLERRLPYAFDPQIGYLTGCPTNVGTGLRASVMLHLPALSLVRDELGKVFTAAQRTGLAVRGLYGEGSRAAGDCYQISNQVTLGRDEDSLIDDLRALVPVIVDFERKVRAALLDDQRSALTDRIMQAVGVLRTSRTLATDDALTHLSSLRLGHSLGILKKTPLEVLRELSVQVHKGHLQAMDPKADAEAILDPSERDIRRAQLLRRRLV